MANRIDRRTFLLSLLAVYPASTISRIGPPVATASPLAVTPPPREFLDQFEVRSIGYHKGARPLCTELVRNPNFRSRLCPVPDSMSAFQSSSGFDVVPILDVDSELKTHKVEKLYDLPCLAANLGGITSGRFYESGGKPVDFVTVSCADTSIYSMSISGVGHNRDFSFDFAADGAAAKGNFSDSGFIDEEVQGSLLHFSSPENIWPTVKAERFASLNHVAVDLRPDVLRVQARGVGILGDITAPIITTVNAEKAVVNLQIQNEATGEMVFSGSSPRDEWKISLAGGAIPTHENTGNILVLDRATGEIIRRIPIAGSLSGSTWDGEHLWQALPNDRVLAKVDILHGGGKVGEVPAPREGMVAGLSFDGLNLVLGVCDTHIESAAALPWDTTIQVLNRETGEVIKKIPRPRYASSGMSYASGSDWGQRSGEIFAAVCGLDLTPASWDSIMAVLDRDEGGIKETILLPDEFYVGEIHEEEPHSLLMAVTEGRAALSRNAALWRMRVS